MQPANQGTSHTLTDQERLTRVQAIINRVIQERIQKAEATKESLSVPDTWERERLVLEQYFASATIPPGPIRINEWTTVHDPIKAIHYHLAGLKASPPGSIAARAYLNHLKELKAAIEA